MKKLLSIKNMTHELHTLSIKDFEPFMHQKIGIRFTPTIRLEAELIEIKSFQNYSPLERLPFAMVLRTEQKKEYYPQSIFIIEHPQKGDLPLFLVPIGFDAHGMKYEVIFS
jgi:hypothetical protein